MVHNSTVGIFDYGTLVELVTISHCHCEGHGFEPRTSRNYYLLITIDNYLDMGSSPINSTISLVHFGIGNDKCRYR